MKLLRKFFSVLIMLLCLGGTAFAATANLPAPDVGDHGTWATENNRDRFVADVSGDITSFQGEFQKNIINNYVPVEAKVGLAFMNAFSFISRILDASLVRFVILFIILAYTFWVMFEAYTIIVGKSKLKDKIIDILKKGMLVAIWTGILSVGPAKTFMILMSPILQVATYTSNGILNVVSGIVGMQLPDTCAAIREYAAVHISDTNILSPQTAADIMCLPTRLSGFCYTAIAVGWRWMIGGIGSSAFTFLCGGAFVAGFLYLTWRFAFIAFGVIADLFLGVIMLPFTAVAETIGKTSYKGIAGDIFNTFMGLFKAESLQTQIMRFVNAALHFIVLAVVIAVASGLISGLIDMNMGAQLPDFETPEFWISVLMAALAWYLAGHAMEFATEFGGAINTTMGDTLEKDSKTLLNKTKVTATKWWQIIKSGGKK